MDKPPYDSVYADHDQPKTPRKHADLIKAWADGAEIQVLGQNDGWITIPNPRWLENGIYRIKPVPKADYVMRGLLTFQNFSRIQHNIEADVTFDGETGEAKKVEIVK